MNAQVRSRQYRLKFVVLALVAVLLLAGCERPLQNVTDGEPSPTIAAEPTELPPGGVPTDVTPTFAPTVPSADDDPTTAPPAQEPEMTATPPDEDESPRTGDEGDGATGEDATTEPTQEPTDEATPEPTLEPTSEPTAAPTGTPTGGDEERVHVVQAGENLYRIGLQYGISWTVLAQHNNIANPNSLVVGQEIRIPPTGGAEATPAPEVTHVVQPGETLFIISQQYGVSWPDIAAANNLAAPYTIYAGQTLVIPGGQ